MLYTVNVWRSVVVSYLLSVRELRMHCGVVRERCAYCKVMVILCLEFIVHTVMSS